MTRYRGFVSSTGAVVIVPEENEKSEPLSNRKQVRIFLVWWARVDSNNYSFGLSIPAVSENAAFKPPFRARHGMRDAPPEWLEH
jgi:hypothetical protein